MATGLEKIAADRRNLMCRLSVVVGGQERAVGSAFLAVHGLVTASHCIQPPAGSQFVVRHVDGATWTMSAQEARQRVIAEKLEHDYDYALVSLKDAPSPFIPGELAVDPPAVPPVGRQVVYFGYPFGAAELVVSAGLVSSVGVEHGVNRLRIDGSVNRGNSGGPLFDAVTGQLIAIVTRAEVGFVVSQFKAFQQQIAQNVKLLEQMPAMITIGGFNPVDGIRATMASIGVLAEQLERSANVGIGFAFLTDSLATAVA